VPPRAAHLSFARIWCRWSFRPQTFCPVTCPAKPAVDRNPVSALFVICGTYKQLEHRMKITQGTIYLSASDLSAHISCKHVTWLNLQLVQKKIPSPPVYENPSLEALQQRGEEFEKKYIEKLKQEGKRIAEIFKGNTEKALDETVEAMRAESTSFTRQGSNTKCGEAGLTFL
jgi:hypothetical protein